MPIFSEIFDPKTEKKKEKILETTVCVKCPIDLQFVPVDNCWSCRYFVKYFPEDLTKDHTVVCNYEEGK